MSGVCLKGDPVRFADGLDDKGFEDGFQDLA